MHGDAQAAFICLAKGSARPWLAENAKPQDLAISNGVGQAFKGPRNLAIIAYQTGRLACWAKTGSATEPFHRHSNAIMRRLTSGLKMLASGPKAPPVSHSGRP